MDNGNQAMVHEQQEPIEAQDVAADAAEGLSEEEAAIVGFFRSCNGANRPCVQDEDYQNNLDDAVGHMFFRMDEQLREDDEWRALANPCHRFSFNLLKCLKAPACVKGTPYSEGSTASVALISGNRIIVGSVGDSRCVLSRNGQGTTGLHTICDGLLDHCIKSRDNMTVILVQFKPAARIPLPAPPAVMPAAQPSACETSSGTSSVIKEDPPASVNNA
ncbi:hypothetical protein QYE76_022773 [Lolium multiflorum]|uniref:protein-serine/threonine phosphatase n=1 Tax=Lolium multiflorum TaxID=4521 RepID=A0AAD8VTJ0_LOLMU|nr:hypothetical protein QYE76_022773 [Lolium multiflorum]